jgi:hypothetical protein
VTYHRLRMALLILLVVSWNRGKGWIADLKVHRSVMARIVAGGADGEKGRYLPAVRCTIEGVKELRVLTREEWLADKPRHFEWVD